MGFDTISFWLGLFFLVFIYQFLTKKIYCNILLLVASYAIYGAWDLRFLPFIFLSTIVDFSVGHWASPANKYWHRRMALFISLFVNLGLLASCKYLLEIFNVDDLYPYLGTYLPDTLVDIGLPLGISFYTFQTLSYTIDVYRGKIKPTSNIIDFALYVSFFPQLTAGPIEKARRLLPQISNDRTVKWEDVK
ncbi:MAG: MBOAT family protein, partial [Halobacteriovoraceae bacterium]|nr:MBOAT family protein [Halobacteriovoraceae bacterium]